MADGNDPQTVPTPPAATDGQAPHVQAPAATTQSNGGGTATGEEETITLKQSDYKNLISQRDKNAEASRSSEEFVMNLAKEREIDSFLTVNKEKYSDVSRDDLMHLSDPDDLEKEAERVQRRFDDVVQKKLMDVQRTTAPIMSPEQRSEAEKQLKANPTRDSFDKMLDMRSQPAS